VTWDYRCPFARNGHEHLLDGLEAGAPWDVTFVPFFLNQSHVPEGGVAGVGRSGPPAGPAGRWPPASWCKDRFPEHFPAVHRSLFAARHDEGGDLRVPAVVRGALARAGADADAVLAEVESGWPAKIDPRRARARWSTELEVFGVPTFIVGDDAVFVRLMSRPDGDAALARATVDRVLDLMTDHPDLNEFKHTRLTRLRALRVPPHLVDGGGPASPATVTRPYSLAHDAHQSRPVLRPTPRSGPAVPNGAPQKSVAPMSASRRTWAFTSAAVPTMATSAGPPAPSRSSMAR
jgi:hypothetical protein